MMYRIRSYLPRCSDQSSCRNVNNSHAFLSSFPMGVGVGNSPHPDIPMLVALDGKYIDLRVIILDRNLTV